MDDDQDSAVSQEKFRDVLWQKVNQVSDFTLLHRDQVHRFHVKWGNIGIRALLPQIAAERRDSKALAWEKLEELQNGDPFDTLTYSDEIHPMVLELCVVGEIPRFLESSNDGSTLGAYLSCHLSRHEPQTRAMTYINYVCRKRWSNAPSGSNTQEHISAQNPEHAGFGVTPEELLYVVETMMNYCEIFDEATDKLAAEIDRTLFPLEEEDVLQRCIGGRRYLPNERSRQVLFEWRMHIRRNVLELIQQRFGTISGLPPFQWCFNEVGFSVNGLQRGQQHAIHSNTNYLFGLFTAILYYRFPGIFKILLLRLNRVGTPEDADAVESLGCVLTGSYWDVGGLKPSLAGGAALRGDRAISRPERAAFFKANADEWETERNFERSARATMAGIEHESQMEELREEYAKLTKECEGRAAEAAEVAAAAAAEVANAAEAAETGSLRAQSTEQQAETESEPEDDDEDEDSMHPIVRALRRALREAEEAGIEMIPLD